MVHQWEEDLIQEVLMVTIQKLNLKNGQVLWPFRAALTGEKFSPGAFECASVLGKEETIKRLEKAIKMI